MPTHHRRLHVTLTPELSEVLERLSAAVGQPMASLVRGLLLDALPVLQEMAGALELANTKPREAVDAMTTHAWRAVGELAEVAQAAQQHQRSLPLPKPKAKRKRGARRM